jgi:hypothetical protein
MFNTNYWGLWVVPVGVALCFGPALLVWLKAELSEKEEEEPQGTKPQDPASR